jgi:hypothetical protein
VAVAARRERDVGARFGRREALKRVEHRGTSRLNYDFDKQMLDNMD